MNSLEIIIALISLGSLLWSAIAFLYVTDHRTTSTPKTSPQLDVPDLMRDPQEWVDEACAAVEREQDPPTDLFKALISAHEYILPSRNIHSKRLSPPTNAYSPVERYTHE